MSRVCPSLLLLAVPVILATACSARTPAPPPLERPAATLGPRPLGTPYVVRIKPRTDNRTGGGTIEFRSPRLALAYAWALARSPRFREAMAEYSAGPRFLLRVGYAHAFGDRYTRFAANHGGAAIFAGHGDLQPRDGTPVDAADIVFFTQDAEAIAIAGGMEFEQLVEQLSLMLVHEVYGHALPLVERGVWPLPCDDPPFASPPWVLGCAAERENEIRADMGVDSRRRYAGYADLSFLCMGDPSFCPRPPRERGVQAGTQ
jgi:hypothetical protein